MITFIKKVVTNRKREYLTLTIILSILASFEFCTLAMYSSMGLANDNMLVTMALNGLPTLTTFISLVLSVFIAKYFIDSKKQEFSILLLSGRDNKDLFLYLLIQYGVLVLISFIIGSFLGYFLVILMNTVIQQLSIPYLLKYSFLDTLYLYIIFMFITIMFILAVSAHQFIMLDRSLSAYLSRKKSIDKAPYKMQFSAISKNKIPVSSILTLIFGICIFVFYLRELLNSQTDIRALWFYYIFTLLGLSIIINKTMPLIYDFFHRQLIKYPVLFHVFAYFNDFSKALSVLVNLNANLIPTMLFLVIISEGQTILQVIVIPCFIMTVIMIGLCFILRYIMYDKHIRTTIATLNAVGYGPKKLKVILSLKNVFFILFEIVVPLILFLVLALRYLNYNVCICLTFVYVLLYLIVILFIFIKENKMIKEVAGDVQYLNRGE